jgi:signal transduction histidine kinase
VNFNVILLSVSALANIGLGWLVYRRHRRSPINISFGVFVLNIALWTLAVLMGILAKSAAGAFLGIRLSFALAAFIPATFYLFACVFPEGRSIKKLPNFIFLISSTAMAVLIFHPTHLKAVTLGPGIPITEYGPLFSLFVIYFLALMAISLIKLGRKLRVCSGIKRLQIQYVFLGSLLALICASLSNFIAPLLGAFQTEGYGPAFSLLMTVCICYAIVKYSLMDITIVIKSTTLYAVLTVAITAGYIGIVVVSNWLFGDIIGIQSLIPAMLAALLIAFAFAPLKEAIQKFIDRTLFKRRYDHRKIISDLSKNFTSIFNIEKLLDLILKGITGAMGIRKGAIYLRKRENGDYLPYARIIKSRCETGLPIIAAGDQLLHWITQSGEIVVREQLERLSLPGESRVVAGLLIELGFEVCVPICTKNNLTGLIFLGIKERGESFTREDIRMFSTISHHIAVAIENIRLFAEKKIIEVRMRRADRLASLGTLAAGVAHEIKNPLVSLKTFTQLLPERYRDREFRESFTQLAGQEVDRINNLVDRLLDFARPVEPEFRLMDLGEVLDDTLLLLRNEIAVQKITVRKDFTGRHLNLEGDREKLKQVFLNLIINALDSMREEGVLAIDGRMIRNNTSGEMGVHRGLDWKLRRVYSSDRIMIKISDNGDGIDPGDLPHLFDPFFTTKVTGTGLGLAIAHNIIEEHGGITEVESVVGRGTTFTITLPMEEMKN